MIPTTKSTPEADVKKKISAEKYKLTKFNSQVFVFELC